MKSQFTIISKYFAATLFVFALIIPTEMNASSSGDRDGSRDRHRDGDGGRDSGKFESGCRRGCPHDGGHNDSIPLDGGLGILVLGAAAFGVRKLRGNKEK